VTQRVTQLFTADVDLTIGDYEVTLTSAEVMEIIEGLEMIGIRVVVDHPQRTSFTAL
jgi:hypothetical protein